MRYTGKQVGLVRIGEGQYRLYDDGTFCVAGEGLAPLPAARWAHGIGGPIEYAGKLYYWRIGANVYD